MPEILEPVPPSENGCYLIQNSVASVHCSAVTKPTTPPLLLAMEILMCSVAEIIDSVLQPDGRSGCERGPARIARFCNRVPGLNAADKEKSAGLQPSLRDFGGSRCRLWAQQLRHA